MNYLDLFSPWMRQKPKLVALASAILDQIYDLITVTSEIGEAYCVENAEGELLDSLGSSVDIRREPGWTDSEYREYLKKKLAVYSWKGTNDTVDEVLAGQTGATMSDNCDGTVSISPADGVFPVPAGIRAVASP